MHEHTENLSTVEKVLFFKLKNDFGLNQYSLNNFFWPRFYLRNFEKYE